MGVIHRAQTSVEMRRTSVPAAVNHQPERKPMILHLETETGEIQDAPAVETNHPQLALVELPCRRRLDGAVTGTTWCIAHIKSGSVVLGGLLTKDLAHTAVAFLCELGMKFEDERQPMPQEFALFQAAVSLMADTYLGVFYPAETGAAIHA